MELDQDSQAENGKLRVPRQSSAPMFNVQPNKQYYLTPDAPAIMDCGTVGIDTLVFTSVLFFIFYANILTRNVFVHNHSAT